MKGKLTIARVYDEETNSLLSHNTTVDVDLFTVKLDFFGYVIMVNRDKEGERGRGAMKMTNPEVHFGTTEIFINGPVLVSPNFSVYQEWVFEPSKAA